MYQADWVENPSDILWLTDGDGKYFHQHQRDWWIRVDKYGKAYKDGGNFSDFTWERLLRTYGHLEEWEPDRANVGDVFRKADIGILNALPNGSVIRYVDKPSYVFFKTTQGFVTIGALILHDGQDLPLFASDQQQVQVAFIP